MGTLSICKKDGWTTEKRKFISEYDNVLLNQKNMIPKFTTHGYKKMEIPKSLYSLIYNARNTSELQIEEPCQILSNCRTKIMNIQQKANIRNEIYRQLSPIMA